MALLKCHAGVTSECCSRSSMASSGSHFKLMPLLSSERSSKANIFPATLKTRADSLNGKPSVTAGLAMQYSRISSMFMYENLNFNSNIQPNSVITRFSHYIQAFSLFVSPACINIQSPL